MTRVAVIDSGVANLASVLSAFRRLGTEALVARAPCETREATHLVLPGVGAFGPAMEQIRSTGMDRVITAWVKESRPLFAVCLGMHVLYQGSEESPGRCGLGIFRGTCRRLPDTAHIPHLGWNWVEATARARWVTSGYAAFANSYGVFDPGNGCVAGWTTHGRRFAAAIELGRILACQFHPELSGTWGLELLRRWLTDSTASRSTRHTPPIGAVQRLVPCLDVRDGRVVKGVQFGNLRDAGDPAARALEYERQGADELVVLDVAASPAFRKTDVDTVRRVREVLAIPLTVGGGVRSARDTRQLLAAGADKVSVNTAAVQRPELITELADAFGSQCVVLAIDARRTDGGWEARVMGGHQSTARDAVEWARRGADLGAGELLVTSWDRDGTRRGCDLALLRQVTTSVSVPVIASGGIGTRNDIADGFAAGAAAVLAASIFHDNSDSVMEIKRDLARRGLRVRL